MKGGQSWRRSNAVGCGKRLIEGESIEYSQRFSHSRLSDNKRLRCWALLMPPLRSGHFHITQGESHQRKRRRLHHGLDQHNHIRRLVSGALKFPPPPSPSSIPPPPSVSPKSNRSTVYTVARLHYRLDAESEIGAF